MAYRIDLRGILAALIFFASLAAAPAALAQEDTAFDPAAFDVGLELVAEGFERPVAVAQPGDGSGRLFVAEQNGRIRTVTDGTIGEMPYLDLTDRVGAGGNEQGLLGLAFPANFAESGAFYVYYTDLDGNTVVSRFRSGPGADVADPESEEIILQQEQPFPNHNGGQLAFGPDNYLYIGLGDGGSQGDPNNNGQSVRTWLGKILRIEVDPDVVPEGQTYAIPEDNPFVSWTDAQPEIWAVGLRNPWRFSFDRETGDLWVGDVGQNAIEEINHVPAADAGGQNFGWNVTEGTSCYLEPECDTGEFMLPVFEYTHDVGGCSVTGGYVYRGEAFPDLVGTYLFADYCSGLLWGGGQDASGAWVMSDPIETNMSISSFGEDVAGELYVTDLSGGAVYRIASPL